MREFGRGAMLATGLAMAGEAMAGEAPAGHSEKAEPALVTENTPITELNGYKVADSVLQTIYARVAKGELRFDKDTTPPPVSATPEVLKALADQDLHLNSVGVYTSRSLDQGDSVQFATQLVEVATGKILSETVQVKLEVLPGVAESISVALRAFNSDFTMDYTVFQGGRITSSVSIDLSKAGGVTPQ